MMRTVTIQPTFESWPTNAVKHFKFVPRGKRRIHQTPRLTEIVACRPWVEAELALVKPDTLGGADARGRSGSGGGRIMAGL